MCYTFLNWSRTKLVDCRKKTYANCKFEIKTYKPIENQVLRWYFLYLKQSLFYKQSPKVKLARFLFLNAPLLSKYLYVCGADKVH